MTRAAGFYCGLLRSHLRTVTATATAARMANLRDAASMIAAFAPQRLYRSSQLYTLDHSPRTIIDLRRQADKVHDKITTTPAGVRLVSLPLVSRGTGLALLGQLPFSVLLGFFASGGQPEIIAEHFMATPDATIVMYSAIMEGCAPEFQRLMLLFADPEAYPVHVHCVAGKDRTGIVVAVLARLCGGDVDEIARDYAASAAELKRARDTGAFGPEMESTLRDSVLASEWEAMTGLLRTMDVRYGGARDYLANHCRIAEPVIEAAVANLTRKP